MALFGLYGEHTVESCPLNNQDSKKAVRDGRITLEDPVLLKEKYKISQIIGQYHSALEHTFLWVIEADDPHLIQQVAIDSKLASFNSVRIVPLIQYADIIAKCENAE